MSSIRCRTSRAPSSRPRRHSNPDDHSERRRLVRYLIALLVASSAWAHDFWIEPSTFHPAQGERVTAALRVGQKLQGEAVPRIPPLVDRFVLGGAPMIGYAGSDPAGIALVTKPGFQWIGYQSNAFPMTNDVPKFEQYLRDEGLDGVITIRSQ